MVHRRRTAGPGGGFTLIELLVVVAVIAILAALLMPVVVRAMAQGQCSTCLGHMRQLYQGCTMYASQHRQIVTITYQHSNGLPVHLQQCLVDDGRVDPRELTCPAEAMLSKKDYETWYESRGETGAPLWWYTYNRPYAVQELGRPVYTSASNRAELLLSTEVKNPGNVVYWADGCYYALWYRAGCDPTYPEDRTSKTKRRVSFRHMDGLNLLYFDGHAEWMLGREIHPRMWVPSDNW